MFPARGPCLRVLFCWSYFKYKAFKHPQTSIAHQSNSNNNILRPSYCSTTTFHPPPPKKKKNVFLPALLSHFRLQVELLQRLFTELRFAPEAEKSAEAKTPRRPNRRQSTKDEGRQRQNVTVSHWVASIVGSGDGDLGVFGWFWICGVCLVVVCFWWLFVFSIACLWNCCLLFKWVTVNLLVFKIVEKLFLEKNMFLSLAGALANFLTTVRAVSDSEFPYNSPGR